MHVGRDEDAHDDAWYQASYTSVVDEGVTGSIKFGDSSAVDIRGRGTVLFTCQNEEHLALTGVYYIPQLRNNIVRLEQLDGNGYQTLIQDGVLTIHDQQRRTLARVNHTRNRLYVLTLSITQLVCLFVRYNDGVWQRTSGAKAGGMQRHVATRRSESGQGAHARSGAAVATHAAAVAHGCTSGAICRDLDLHIRNPLCILN